MLIIALLFAAAVAAFTRAAWLLARGYRAPEPPSPLPPPTPEPPLLPVVGSYRPGEEPADPWAPGYADQHCAANMTVVEPGDQPAVTFYREWHAPWITRAGRTYRRIDDPVTGKCLHGYAVPYEGEFVTYRTFGGREVRQYHAPNGRELTPHEIRQQAALVQIADDETRTPDERHRAYTLLLLNGWNGADPPSHRPPTSRTAEGADKPLTCWHLGGEDMCAQCRFDVFGV